MRRHAVIPFNKRAVQEADDEFYLKYPGMVKSRKRIHLERKNVAQWRLREDWMDMYVAKGGEAERANDDGQKPVESIIYCPSLRDAPKLDLSIQVIDDSDNSPITDATVSISNTAIFVQGLGKRNTGSDGVASFKYIDPGVYDLAVLKKGYIPVPGYEDRKSVV